jgi:hypothetical protein
MIKLVAIGIHESTARSCREEFEYWLAHNCVDNAVVAARPSWEDRHQNEYAEREVSVGERSTGTGYFYTFR